MNTSTNMADVGQQDFEQQVLQRSHKQLVLVDFWAAWCGPCQMLMPLLAKLADEYRGAFFLAKVNSDKEQGLAQHYGVRSLPTVKAFKNGAVVDEFMGAQSEAVIRALIDKHAMRASDKLVAAALAARAENRLDEALRLLEQACADDPGNDKALVAYADALLADGRQDRAHDILAGLPFSRRQEPAVVALEARLEFAGLAATAPPTAALKERVSAAPADIEARYQLAGRSVAEGDYEAALEQLLEIVRRDRKFQDDAGRKAMLRVFTLLGNKGELVNRYRGLLSTALN